MTLALLHPITDISVSYYILPISGLKYYLVFPENTRGLGRIVFHLAPASSTVIRGVGSSFAAGGGNSKNLLKEPASFRLCLQTWTYKSNEITEYMTYLKYSHIQLQGKASSARRRPYLFTFQGDGVFQRRHLQKNGRNAVKEDVFDVSSHLHVPFVPGSPYPRAPSQQLSLQLTSNVILLCLGSNQRGASVASLCSQVRDSGCCFDKAMREILCTAHAAESNNFWQCVLCGTQGS